MSARPSKGARSRAEALAAMLHEFHEMVERPSPNRRFSLSLHEDGRWFACCDEAIATGATMTEALENLPAAIRAENDEPRERAKFAALMARVDGVRGRAEGS